MTAAEWRAKVKRRLYIAASVATFDSDIDDFVSGSVNRLAPFALRELAPVEVDVTPDSFGEVWVDLSGVSVLGSVAHSARYVEAMENGSWFPADDTFHHGVNLRVRSLPTSTSTLKIYGLVTYEITNVPANIELAVIWYAMSEFYDYLVGDKRKYNVYMQNNARAVDNLQELSEYYEAKANTFLNDHAQLYGVQ